MKSGQEGAAKDDFKFPSLNTQRNSTTDKKLGECRRFLTT